MAWGDAMGFASDGLEAAAGMNVNRCVADRQKGLTTVTGAQPVPERPWRDFKKVFRSSDGLRLWASIAPRTEISTNCS